MLAGCGESTIEKVDSKPVDDVETVATMEEAQEEIDFVVEKVYSNQYFRRVNTPDEQVILKEPRYKVLYDPNLKEYAARVYQEATLIGPASIRGGRRQILNSIIHEEIHHWLDLTPGRPHDEQWIISLTSYIMGKYR